MTAMLRPRQDAHRGPNLTLPPLPDTETMREHLAAVLHDLRFPSQRWQVIAEADAWGVTGTMRRFISRLPDGTYPALTVVVDTLCPRRKVGKR